MRILCLAFLLADYPQLLRKFDAQARGLARFHSCRAQVIGPQELPHGADYAFAYKKLPWSMPLYYAVSNALIEEWRPDVIYFRYIAADEALCTFTARHGNVVFEHNTIEEEEYQGAQRTHERRFGARAVSHAAGACCVTAEILEYERSRSQRPLPGMVMGNGISPEDVSPVAFDLPADAVHMFCAAHFARWHGLDRLIRGMAAYAGPKRFVLHLAGQGPELESYARLAQELGVAEQIHMHGFCQRPALNALTARCHVGVGALGIHRKALQESAAIKLREYCLQGLPFFFSGEDPDFSPLPDFVRSIPCDESPVDMSVVEELARVVEERPELRAEMRRYGQERLSWEAKTERMAVFLEECAANAARQRRWPLAARKVPLPPDALEEHAALWVTRHPQGVFVLDVLDAHVHLLGMSKAACDWIHEAAQTHADTAAVHLWDGFAHEGSKALPQAMAAYMRAMQLDAADWQAPLRLVFLHRALGNAPKAEFFKKICLERNSELMAVLPG